MSDQADVLRKRMQVQQTSIGQPSSPQPDSRMAAVSVHRRTTRVMTVTSGKGGVGKSNFALNFALSLAQNQKKVVLIDMDLGLANLDVLMGVSPSKHLTQLIAHDLSVWDVLEDGPAGIQFIAGGSGLQHTFHAEPHKIEAFLHKMNELQGAVDYLILDMGAGLSVDTYPFLLASDEIIAITTPEPTSKTDVYAVFKMISKHEKRPPFKIVINRCLSQKEGDQTAETLIRASERFLQQSMVHLGNIPQDDHVTKSVRKREPLLCCYPHSAAAKSVRKISAHYVTPSPSHEGGVKQFFKKLIKMTQ